MPLRGSIYPRQCQDCGTWYQNKNSFYKHKKTDVCKRYQERQPSAYQGPVVVDITPQPNATTDSDVTIHVEDMEFKMNDLIDYVGAFERMETIPQLLERLRTDTTSLCRVLICDVVEQVFCAAPANHMNMLRKVCIIKEKEYVKYLNEAVYRGLHTYTWTFVARENFLDKIIKDVQIFLQFLQTSLSEDQVLHERITQLTTNYYDNPASSFASDQKWLQAHIWKAFKADGTRLGVKTWHSQLEKMFNIIT